MNLKNTCQTWAHVEQRYAHHNELQTLPHCSYIQTEVLASLPLHSFIHYITFQSEDQVYGWLRSARQAPEAMGGLCWGRPTFGWSFTHMVEEIPRQVRLEGCHP